jgi:hypothetical protein
MGAINMLGMAKRIGAKVLQASTSGCMVIPSVTLRWNPIGAM